MAKSGSAEASCCCCSVILLLAVAWVLLFAFAGVDPVVLTIERATLGRIVLFSPPDANATSTENGTTASFSYDLSLEISVYNPNRAMSARRTAPLDAELRFRGWAFRRIHMAGAADWHRISPVSTVFRSFTAFDDGVPVPVLKELARESAAGVFELELVVTGEFKYQAHSGRRSLRVSCPLKLALFTAATSRERFRMVQCG